MEALIIFPFAFSICINLHVLIEQSFVQYLFEEKSKEKKKRFSIENICDLEKHSNDKKLLSNVDIVADNLTRK